MHKVQNGCLQNELSERLKGLKKLAPDKFSLAALEGAGRTIADIDNPLRLNFFSTAMRILFEHVTTTLARNDEVVRCSWFRTEQDSGKPTRWQRATFAIQGGFSDEFVTGNLGVDPRPLRKRLLSAIDDLSKHVHGRENTIILDRDEQNAFAIGTVDAMAAFLEAVHDCRAAVLEPIEEELDGTAVDALLSETIGNVDELASHHSIEEIYVDRIFVHTIGADTITYRATGSVSVVLQWGSNSDLRRGDGAELDQSFPFNCDIALPLEEPWEIGMAEISYGVDTSEWTDAMRPDEWAEWI